MTPGIHLGLPNETYHKGVGLSHSGLKRFRRSPFHYHALARPRSAPEKAPTASMFNGTLVHCALLEPDQFDERYAVGPVVNSKAAKEWKEFASFCDQLGIEPITQVERDAAMAQAASLAALPEVAELMGSGVAECSAYWIDPPTGVLCKCRPDWAAHVGYGKGAVLLDVKTTTDASDEAFAKTAGNFGYDWQADWYCHGYGIASGLEVHGMVFAVVESEYPHAARSFMLSDTDLIAAREDNRIALNRYAACEASNEWPAYPPGIQVINVKRWGSWR